MDLTSRHWSGLGTPGREPYDGEMVMADAPAPHETNRRYWDAMASGWKDLRDRDGGWRRCIREPGLGFAGGALELIRSSVGDLAGKTVCVIGSGDNYAAFALAGLGAAVTSTDISERQLDVARERAVELGLEMRFVRTDATGLDPLEGDSFDLVCSTNGFFVWISSPARIMSAVHRVLRPGGHYVFYDVHPFQRPWKDQIPLEMTKSYWDGAPRDDSMESFEYHWTLADLLNSIADAGLAIRRIEERPADDERFWEGHSYEPGIDVGLMDWRRNPRAGLPVWLTVCAQKPVQGT